MRTSQREECERKRVAVASERERESERESERDREWDRERERERKKERKKEREREEACMHLGSKVIEESLFALPLHSPANLAIRRVTHSRSWLLCVSVCVCV